MQARCRRSLEVVGRIVANVKDLLRWQCRPQAQRGKEWPCRLAPADLGADDDVRKEAKHRKAGCHRMKAVIVVGGQSQAKALRGELLDHGGSIRVKLPGLWPCEMFIQLVKAGLSISNIVEDAADDIAPAPAF